MSKEIKLNIDLFRNNVESLHASLSNLNPSISRTQSFNNTTINPFKNDLENVVKALDLLEKYKVLIHSDINTLHKTGEEIKEQDESLANYTGSLGGNERREV